MKAWIYAALVTFLFALPLSTKAEDGDGKNITAAYIFAVGISHTDSVVYISEIQKLDEAIIENKTGFLNRMPEYSDQFRSALTSAYSGYITCSVFYDAKLEKVQKKRAKLISLYGQKKNYMQVVEIENDKFTFTPLRPVTMTRSETVPLGVGPAYMPNTEQ